MSTTILDSKDSPGVELRSGLPMSNDDLKKVEGEGGEYHERRHDHNSRSLDKIDWKLDQVLREQKEILKKVEKIETDQIDYRLWKQSIETRLKEGDKRMTDIEDEIEPQEEMDKRYIKTEMVKWIALGFILAGGAGGVVGHLALKALGLH